MHFCLSLLVTLGLVWVAYLRVFRGCFGADLRVFWGCFGADFLLLFVANLLG